MGKIRMSLDSSKLEDVVDLLNAMHVKDYVYEEIQSIYHDNQAMGKTKEESRSSVLKPLISYNKNMNVFYIYWCTHKYVPKPDGSYYVFKERQYTPNKRSLDFKSSFFENHSNNPEELNVMNIAEAQFHAVRRKVKNIVEARKAIMRVLESEKEFHS
jgi:hypothetical protein